MKKKWCYFIAQRTARSTLRRQWTCLLVNDIWFSNTAWVAFTRTTPRFVGDFRRVEVRGELKQKYQYTSAYVRGQCTCVCTRISLRPLWDVKDWEPDLSLVYITMLWFKSRWKWGKAIVWSQGVPRSEVASALWRTGPKNKCGLVQRMVYLSVRNLCVYLWVWIYARTLLII